MISVDHGYVTFNALLKEVCVFGLLLISRSKVRNQGSVESIPGGPQMSQM